MKIISSLKNIDMLEKVIPFVDGVVLGCQYSAYCDNVFDEDEIRMTYQKLTKINKKTYVLLNLVMHENDIDGIKKFIDKFIDLDIYYIFQDLGILNILKLLNKEKYGIYNPLTMITNYCDLLEYEVFNMDAIGVSNEIPLKDVELCSSHCSNVFYLGFGYHPMYQTYRNLLSLYKEHSGLNFSNDNLYLQEATREDDRCPVIENNYGTIVFRSGVISVLEKIDLLDNIKYLFLDGIFISEEKFISVLELYYQVINKDISITDGLNKISKLELTFNNQFMESDSVYNPKEFE